MRQAIALTLVALVLSGCADAPPVLEARQETREVPATEAWPGLTVRGSLVAGDGELTVTAFAHNTGNRTYRIEVACGPWAEELYRGGERVLKEEPEDCHDFQLASLAPGASVTSTFAWSGRLWDEDSGRRLDAPEGDYVWSVRFSAYQPEGVQIKRYDLDFPVTVR